MLRSSLVLAVLLSVGLASAASGKDAPSTSQKSPQQQLLQAPLSFEANSGQTDARARYFARTPGLAIFLTSNEAVLKMARGNSTQALRLQWVGSRAPHLVPEQALPGKVNYLRGNDPAKWQTDISTYGRVRYAGLYPGVDLVYYGSGQHLEYDMVVAPHADPAQVRLRVEGARHLRIARNGDLVISLADGELRQHRPIIYQVVGGKRRSISGGYVLRTNSAVGFRLGRYDRSRELVVDPTLSYATYLGGKYTDRGNGVAVDSAGNSYITGTTVSPDFPMKNRAEGQHADYDAFVTKLNSTGSGLVYSTYLGGSGHDEGVAVGVDANGFAYVVGSTASTNFPVTSSAFQKVNHGGSDAFVTKLNQAGNAFVYSTYLGGTNDDQPKAITLDSSHRVYVTGYTGSVDFPLHNAFQSALKTPGNPTGFVTRLSADGSSLSYSTYLGGSNFDWGFGIAVDSSSQAFVCGFTGSSDFPTTAGAFNTTYQGENPPDDEPGAEGFVAKFSATGTSLIYSTFTGGHDALGVTVDSQDRAYVVGNSFNGTVTTTTGAFQTKKPSGFATQSPFAMRLNAAGSALSYSTYLGGSNFDGGVSIAVDSSFHAYVFGSAESTNFPVKNTIQTTGTMFLSKLWATGGGLIWSTYLGSPGPSAPDSPAMVRLDGSGNPYLTGTTTSSAFPATAGAFDRTLGGMADAFVMKVKN